MSSVLKKEDADKIVFKHNPKAFFIETSKVAKAFVSLQGTHGSDFQIAAVVAEQSGVEALRKKNIESQVEGTVLERLKEIEEQAYKKSFELGMIEGSEKAFEEKRNEFEIQLKRLDSLFLTLENIKVELLKSSEAEIIKFIHNLSSRIAMRDIQLDKEPLIEMLTQVISDVQGAETVNVHMNPFDVQFIEQLRANKVKDNELLNRLKVLTDPTITSGGCRVETIFGTIDGTVEQRIAKAWTILEAKLPPPAKDKY